MHKFYVRTGGTLENHLAPQIRSRRQATRALMFWQNPPKSRFAAEKKSKHDLFDAWNEHFDPVCVVLHEDRLLSPWIRIVCAFVIFKIKSACSCEKYYNTTDS